MKNARLQMTTCDGVYIFVLAKYIGLTNGEAEGLPMCRNQMLVNNIQRHMIETARYLWNAPIAGNC